MIEYYDGKQHVSEFARFKMFPIKKIIKIDRDIDKKSSLGCRLVLFRYGDHTLGFQIKGRETIALVFAQPHIFFAFFFAIDKTSRYNQCFVQNDTLWR